jgi:hypothetical protein
MFMKFSKANPLNFCDYFFDIITVDHRVHILLCAVDLLVPNRFTVVLNVLQDSKMDSRMPSAVLSIGQIFGRTTQ